MRHIRPKADARLNNRLAVRRPHAGEDAVHIKQNGLNHIEKLLEVENSLFYRCPLAQHPFAPQKI
jgi:hypothetical protein